MPPIITLTTDFGTADHYVGTMKGVLLSRCPEAQIVDVSHDIAPFSIYEGAYAIAQTAPYFAAGTIHVVVVDPGVGTARRAMCMRASGQLFVAPDNGVLTLIAGRDHEATARELTNRALWLQEASVTFHGRDIFSAVAGALASGQARFDDVGPEMRDWVALPDIEARQTAANTWRGVLLSVDRFGNAITNFESAAFGQLARERFQLRAGDAVIDLFRRTFAEAARDEIFAYYGSSGFIEIGMNQRSAAERLGLRAGQPVTLQSPA